MNSTQPNQHYFDPNYGQPYQPDADQEGRAGVTTASQQRSPQVRQPTQYRNMIPPMPHYGHDPRVVQNQTEFDDDANDFDRAIPVSGTTNGDVPDGTSAPGNAYASLHSRLAGGLIVSPLHRTQFERCRQISHLLREEDMRSFANQQGNEFPVPRQLRLSSKDALSYLNTTLLPPSLSMPPSTRNRSKLARSIAPPAAVGQPFNANNPAAYQTLHAHFPASPTIAVPNQRSLKRIWGESNDYSGSNGLNDDTHRHVAHRHYADGRQAPQPAANAADRDNILRKV